MPILLNTAYFPPISFYAAAAMEFDPSSDKAAIVYVEACENYQKQSYRNRCDFYSASGRQSLSFPIVHIGGTHNNIPIKEVLIDYSVPWVVRHKRAIASAYHTSAFFDYYADELFSILDRGIKTLYDLNKEIMVFFFKETGIEVDLRDTDDFLPSDCNPANCHPVYYRRENCRSTEFRWYGRFGLDLRETIHPKRPDTILAELGLEKPYYQVFSQKYGFIPNLSVMDLLFNEGPESVIYLKRLDSLSQH